MPFTCAAVSTFSSLLDLKQCNNKLFLFDPLMKRNPRNSSNPDNWNECNNKSDPPPLPTLQSTAASTQMPLSTILSQSNTPSSSSSSSVLSYFPLTATNFVNQEDRPQLPSLSTFEFAEIPRKKRGRKPTRRRNYEPLPLRKIAPLPISSTPPPSTTTTTTLSTNNHGRMASVSSSPGDLGYGQQPQQVMEYSQAELTETVERTPISNNLPVLAWYPQPVNMSQYYQSNMTSSSYYDNSRGYYLMSQQPSYPVPHFVQQQPPPPPPHSIIAPPPFSTGPPPPPPPTGWGERNESELGLPSLKHVLGDILDRDDVRK